MAGSAIPGVPWHSSFLASSGDLTNHGGLPARADTRRDTQAGIARRFQELLCLDGLVELRRLDDFAFDYVAFGGDFLAKLLHRFSDLAFADGLPDPEIQFGIRVGREKLSIGDLPLTDTKLVGGLVERPLRAVHREAFELLLDPFAHGDDMLTIFHLRKGFRTSLELVIVLPELGDVRFRLSLRLLVLLLQLDDLLVRLNAQGHAALGCLKVPVAYEGFGFTLERLVVGDLRIGRA